MHGLDIYYAIYLAGFLTGIARYYPPRFIFLIQFACFLSGKVSLPCGSYVYSL